MFIRHSGRLGIYAGNFAIGEYTPALRLASELAELRAEYANPYSVAEPWSVFFRGNNKTAYVSC